MGENYLIDTNIIIYYLKDSIPEKELYNIEKIFEDSFNISLLTRIEFLGWKYHTDEGYKISKEFISRANIYMLNDEIAELTIDLKRKQNIKLADAVIACTALVHNSILVTRNSDDFKMIEALKLYNPYQLI